MIIGGLPASSVTFDIVLAYRACSSVLHRPRSRMVSSLLWSVLPSMGSLLCANGRLTSRRSVLGAGKSYDAGVRPELAAAHAAVDEAVKILRDGRARPHKRIGKAAKDFLTDVDLASELAMQRSLAESTPTIGFYGEEGGGAALESGRVWVADPLDGTINYATGSPLCGVMLGLLEDGVPTLGVIDLPFLGVRVDSGAVADVDALEEGIIGMGDAFHRGCARMDAYLELTMTIHRRALRFRCVGAASVLWAWLVDGQIQGMLLSHNNPYDVVAGHAIARAAGAICTDYAGAPLTLESNGAMASVPGIQPELVSLAADLAAASRDS